MDTRTALGWRPPADWALRAVVIDSHTGGEPFRVVVEPGLDIPGGSMLERRNYASNNLDHLRRMLMWEPRGHADMYGGWIGPPVRPDSHLSVLFVHNEGFSTMCGHGVIALAKVVLDTGILPAVEPETTLRIDTPAGQIVARSRIVEGVVVSTAFRNVASFAADLDAVVDVPGLGTIPYDLGFGGAFDAYVDSAKVGIGLDGAAGLIDAGRRIKAAVVAARPVTHPEHDDLGFLYGVIFTGEPTDPGHHSRNVCVFADGEVDRSPTGTGVSARLAILHARGEVATGEDIIVESIVGSTFTGRVVETTQVDGHPAVVPEIEGRAHITGRAEFWLDPSDDLGTGFLIR